MTCVAIGRVVTIATAMALAACGAAPRVGAPPGAVAASSLQANVCRRGTRSSSSQQTLAPLAERLGRTPEVRPALARDALARELRETPNGGVVVVAHHSNGIPRIVRASGTELPGLAKDADALPESDFGRVVVLSLGCDRSRATVVELSSKRSLHGLDTSASSVVGGTSSIETFDLSSSSALLSAPPYGTRANQSVT